MHQLLNTSLRCRLLECMNNISILVQGLELSYAIVQTLDAGDIMNLVICPSSINISEVRL